MKKKKRRLPLGWEKIAVMLPSHLLKDFDEALERKQEKRGETIRGRIRDYVREEQLDRKNKEPSATHPATPPTAPTSNRPSPIKKPPV